jgi:apolipoprotein N-acyltransferase
MQIRHSHFCIAGLVCAIGVLVPPFWFLSVLGLTLVAYEISSRTQTIRARLKEGAVFGVAYTAMVLVWFWYVLPLDWLGASTLASVSVIIFSWLSIAAPMGIVFGGFFAIFSLLQRKNMAWDSLLFASLLVLAQYIQMFVFAMITWNTESLFGPHFSAISMGYSLASFTPFLQLASFGGIYALTFFLAFSASVLCWIFLRFAGSVRNMVLILSTVLIGFVGATFIDETYSLTNPEISARDPSRLVAIVATNFSPHIAHTREEERMRREAMYAALLAWARKHEAPDILVFPEGGRDDSLNFEFLRNLKTQAFGKHPVSIIDSTIRIEQERFFERMFLLDAATDSFSSYDKLFLVPQGEYAPRLAELALQIPGGERFRESLKRAERSYARGETLAAIRISDTKIGALFCSDVLSPSLYQRLAKDGAEFFINASSLAVFHSSPLVDTFVLTIAKVRAVESGRFLAIASHGVPATVISDKGRIVARSGNGEVEVLLYRVPLRTYPTFYVRFGAWVVIFALGTVALSFIVRRRIK